MFVCREGGSQLYGEMREHNYKKLIAGMIVRGQVPSTPGVYSAEVYHDDWCAVFCGRVCNCDPVVVLPMGRSAPKKRAVL